MMEFTTPPSYGSTVVNVGGVVKEDKILYAGSTNSATHLETHTDSENDWPEPKSINFTWKGKGKEVDSVHAVLEGSLGNKLDRIDVMYELPGFVKSFVGSVSGARPYIYQVSNSIRSLKHVLGVFHLLTLLTLFIVLTSGETHAQGQGRRNRVL